MRLCIRIQVLRSLIVKLKSIDKKLDNGFRKLRHYWLQNLLRPLAPYGAGRLYCLPPGESFLPWFPVDPGPRRGGGLPGIPPKGWYPPYRVPISMGCPVSFSCYLLFRSISQVMQIVCKSLSTASVLLSVKSEHNSKYLDSHVGWVNQKFWTALAVKKTLISNFWVK